MKKFVSLLLVLMMACLLIPAMAETATDTGITGIWYGSVYGMNVALTLNEDNTYSLSSGESVITEGTWELKDGVLYMDGGSAEDGFVFNGETLRNEVNDATFTRDAMDLEPVYTPQPVNPDAQAEDFNGNWKGKYITSQGLTFDIESAVQAGQLEGIPDLVFQDGKLGLTGAGLESLLGDSDLELTFADGKYSYSLDFGDISMGFELSLLQDGLLELKISMGVELSLYFEKAE